MSIVAYTKTLINPFDPSVPGLKIYDGNCPSVAYRLRATGDLLCNKDGTYTYLFLVPGASNTIFWAHGGEVGAWNDFVDSTAFPFKAHCGNVDRNSLRSYRVTSAALRLYLTNSGDESEGTWEAIRLTCDEVYLGSDQGTYTTFMSGGYTKCAAAFTDCANNPTYQKGLLKDISRHVFKLNSVNDDHKHWGLKADDISPPEGDTSDTRGYVTWDKNWDVVCIRIKGRVTTGNPSNLNYDTVGHYEVNYRPGTQLSRMETTPPYYEGMRRLFASTRYKLPSIKVA